MYSTVERVASPVGHQLNRAAMGEHDWNLPFLILQRIRSDQPRTHNRECGNQPAYQSLITDVSQAPPPPVCGCTRTALCRTDDATRPEC